MKLVGAGSPSSVWHSGQGELSPLLQRMTSLCALVKSIELFSPKIYPTAHLPLWDCFCCGPCVLFLSGTYCYLTFIYLQVHFFNCLAPIHPHTHIRIFLTHSRYSVFVKWINISKVIFFSTKKIHLHPLVLTSACFSDISAGKKSVKFLAWFQVLTFYIISMGIDTSWMRNIVLKLPYWTLSTLYS